MMTREEAIAVLAESKRQNEVMRDNPSTFWASHQMADGVKNAERRIAALDIALSALRPVSREQVEKVWRGEWERITDPYGKLEGFLCKCGTQTYGASNFCPHCGGAKAYEAVQMVMERLEALKDGVD